MRLLWLLHALHSTGNFNIDLIVTNNNNSAVKRYSYTRKKSILIPVYSRYIKFFERPDIDGWDIRQGMTDILAYDCVPDPCVVISAMYACRRVNDYAMAVRFLEAVKDKCGAKSCEIYPYIIQEIAPVICELGVDTPELLGYDKPELYMKSVYDDDTT